MKHKKVLKKLALLIGTASLALIAFLCPVATIATQAASAEELTVQPRQHDIRYVFKIEDGKMYKRLYDFTTGNWLSDWIYVCDYPG